MSPPTPDEPLAGIPYEISEHVIRPIRGYRDLKEINQRMDIGGNSTARLAYEALKQAYIDYVRKRVIDPEIEGLFGDRGDINPVILGNLLDNGWVKAGPKSKMLLYAAVNDRLYGDHD